MVVVLFCTGVAYSTMTYLRSFTFNEANALQNWREMVLNREVRYELMRQGEEGFVQALSERACSALYYRLSYSLEQYPILKWKWRAVKFPDISRANTPEEKDDYAARVYVIFPFLSFSSSSFIEYIWAQDLPLGTIINSPFGDNIKMLVVRSGKSEEEWVSETRNVYEDYKKVFGKKPGRVGAVAIMCDADGTRTAAEALFDQITIEK